MLCSILTEKLSLDHLTQVWWIQNSSQVSYNLFLLRFFPHHTRPIVYLSSLNNILHDTPDLFNDSEGHSCGQSLPVEPVNVKIKVEFT